MQMGNVNFILIFTASSGYFRSRLKHRIFGVQFWLNILSVGVISVAWTGNARAAAAVYPVKVSANNRYLVDQNNAPFLIMGDCPQSLTVNLSVAQTESFFSNRKAHGFNTMWINLVCTVYTAGRPDGSTFDGILPFTGYLPGSNDLSHFDLSKPNEAFFGRCDQMIGLAAKYNLLVFLDPIETGGWLTNMVNNGPKACYDFGKYLGNRYRHFDNIVWMSGNDYEGWRDSRNDAAVTAVAKGIQATDTRHIHTAELGGSFGLSTDDPQWASIVSLNAAYTYFPTYAKVLTGYNRTNTMPVFMVEACYDYESLGQEHMATPSTLRREEYWADLSGATGLIYGNHYTWTFAQSWESHIDTPGAAQIANLKSFFESRTWYDLVPDQAHTTLTAGYGTFASKGTVDGNDYATAARTQDGRLAIIYAPTIRPLTIDMTRLSGPVTARWFDPANASYSGIEGSPFSNTGSRSFTPPGNNHDGDGDWVLVLEVNKDHL
jgi:hypothetical protein